MSRGDGFDIADVDSSYFEDEKVKRLWRRIKDQDAMARAICLHQSGILASWRHGEAVTVEDAAPLWLDADPDLIAHLVACELVDDAGHVVSFDRWFGAAVARRDVRRAAGRAGGLASGQRRSTTGEANVQQPSTTVQPVATDAEPVRPYRPSVRTVRPSEPSIPARDGLPNLNSAVATFWEQATGRTILASGNYAAEYLDDACRRHAPSEVGAAVLRARKNFDHIPDAAQMVAAMRPILDPLPDRAAVKATDDGEKRNAAAKRQMQLTKHSGGYHIDAADPDCPKCQKGAA